MPNGKLPKEGDTVTVRGRRYEYSELMASGRLYVIDRVERDGDGHSKDFKLTDREIQGLYWG